MSSNQHAVLCSKVTCLVCCCNVCHLVIMSLLLSFLPNQMSNYHLLEWSGTYAYTLALLSHIVFWSCLLSLSFATHRGLRYSLLSYFSDLYLLYSHIFLTASLVIFQLKSLVFIHTQTLHFINHSILSEGKVKTKHAFHSFLYLSSFNVLFQGYQPGLLEMREVET